MNKQGLQRQIKDFQTLHEQANKIVNNFILVYLLDGACVVFKGFFFSKCKLMCTSQVFAEWCYILS